jgi:hypothetical protein
VYARNELVLSVREQEYCVSVWNNLSRSALAAVRFFFPLSAFDQGKEKKRVWGMARAQPEEDGKAWVRGPLKFAHAAYV